jgi:hypothetical protein
VTLLPLGLQQRTLPVLVLDRPGALASTRRHTAPSLYNAPYLARNKANFTAPTPLIFLARAATVDHDRRSSRHPVYLSRVLRPLPAIRKCAARAPHPPRGPRRRHGDQHTGTARGALRRADDGGFRMRGAIISTPTIARLEREVKVLVRVCGELLLVTNYCHTRC